MPVSPRTLTPTEKARAKFVENTALRSARDPIRLRQSLQIVRAGILQGLVKPEDLQGPIVRPEADW
jgi:hypothetical protein